MSLEKSDRQLRKERILQYIPFVHYLVRSQQLPPGMSREDLVQYGICGLIEAVDRFDPEKSGGNFEAFAAKRIKGSVVDNMRRVGKSYGGLSRPSWEKAKMVEKATSQLERSLQRHPTTKEIAAELGMKMEEYLKVLGEISYGSHISLNDLVGTDRNIQVVETVKDDGTLIPAEALLSEEKQRLLGEAIDSLPEKENIVIYLYYYEELTQEEIGAYLNLSESRISQIRTQAILRLRNKLSGGD